MEFFDYPVKNQQFLPNFHFILPKFHFILPNFYFAPRWRIFIYSLAVSDFLGRNWYQRGGRSRYNNHDQHNASDLKLELILLHSKKPYLCATKL